MKKREKFIWKFVRRKPTEVEVVNVAIGQSVEFRDEHASRFL